MTTRNIFIGLVLVLFLMFLSPASAQEASDYSLMDRETVFAASAPFFSVDVGSSFTTAGPAGSFFAHRVAPRLGLAPRNDLQLYVGTVFTSTRMNNMQGLFPYGSQLTGGEQMITGSDGSLFSATIYAYGAYKVNPRLSITGGTWVERTGFDMQHMYPEPMALQQNPRGMMLGFDYKVSENFRFGAEVSVSSGISPYAPMHFQQHPFGGFHHPSPFRRTGPW